MPWSIESLNTRTATSGKIRNIPPMIGSPVELRGRDEEFE
jgi:hypothetical protein